VDDGRNGERVGVGVVRIPLHTPTLPPATETNCYLVGEGDFYVVEPASPWDEPRRLLDEAVRARIARGHRPIAAIVTHHHHDHVGGARHLCDAFSIPLLAHPLTRDRLAGSVRVDGVLDEGDALDPALAALDVAVLHTPGHAPGHLCLFSRAHGWALVGDMVASIGTILIDPSDGGDMDAYLAQLRRLAALQPTRLLPAHGDPVDDAVGRLEFYVAHRLAREARVLGAVRALPTSFDDVVEAAYADTPGAHPELARRSARAHLERLARLGDVAREGDRWRRVT
jgi:ribonuclease/clavin/mitogillin